MTSMVFAAAPASRFAFLRSSVRRLGRSLAFFSRFRAAVRCACSSTIPRFLACSFSFASGSVSALISSLSFLLLSAARAISLVIASSCGDFPASSSSNARWASACLTSASRRMPSRSPYLTAVLVSLPVLGLRYMGKSCSPSLKVAACSAALPARLPARAILPSSFLASAWFLPISSVSSLS